MRKACNTATFLYYMNVLYYVWCTLQMWEPLTWVSISVLFERFPQVFESHVRFREERKGEIVEEHDHHFLWHQGDRFTINLPWKAKQSISHTTVTFYGDSVKMCEKFAPNFGGERTGSCITTNRLTLPLSQGNLLLKTTQLSSPTHPTFLCFLDWR
jgi:hypothetical protein